MAHRIERLEPGEYMCECCWDSHDEKGISWMLQMWVCDKCRRQLMREYGIPPNLRS